MKKILILVLVVCTYSGFAQKTEKSGAFAKMISPDDLKKHLFVIAGPEMEGRETATEGQRKAASYIENNFRRIGLLPVNKGSYQLFYDVFRDSLTSGTLEVNGQNYGFEKDFSASAGNLPVALRFSEVVFVGSNTIDSIKNVNLAGKLVLLVNNIPMNTRGQGRAGIYGALL